MARKGQKERSIVDNLLQNTNLPFSNRVMRFPLPVKFKVPYIKKDSGDVDLVDNMENHRAHLVLYSTPDEMSCKIFPLTLKGSAQDWFKKLPPTSVEDFGVLGVEIFDTIPSCLEVQKTQYICVL
jgi:hypothetical protein